ncbi:MAG: CBS domain-containing protein [Rhodobacteraceae bacterium]|nr:CBS domain-containing protein [Paracoccaceae bacterium]
MTRSATVADAMARNPRTVRPDTPIGDAVALMVGDDISGVPVLDASGTLVGILTAKDCFRAALHASYHQEWSGVTGAYMTHGVQTIEADTDLVTAAQRFLDQDFRRFPVTRDGELVGIVTRLDVLRALHDRWTYAPAPRDTAR